MSQPDLTADEAFEYITIIEALRKDEGNSVTIASDDSDASIRDQAMCVECIGWWTDWNTARFYGETPLAALRQAHSAFIDYCQENPDSA